MRNKTVPNKRSPHTGRRALALLLSCLMLAAMLPIPAGAVEEPGGHIHNETCGYVEDDPDSCNQSAPQPGDGIEPNNGIEPDKCTCEPQCTEGNIDPDCPVCSAEDADLSLCNGAPPARRGTSRTSGTTITVDSENALTSAISNATSGNTLQITNNFTITSGVSIDSKNLTLDLNGYTVTSTVTGTNTGAITLTDTASLTVTDGGSNGKLEVTSTTGKAIYNGGSGEVKVEGGTVTTSGGSSSYAICNSSSGTVNVTGGTVSSTQQGGRAIHNNGAGTITVSGGTVEATGSVGSAIHNNSGGTITVSGNAEVSATGTDGYAIYNNAGGTVTVSDNAAVAVKATGGYAIYNYSTGEVKVEGGEVSATTGNAICNQAGGTVNVSGGKVKAAGANSAIYNYSTGSLNITGGTVEATASNGRAIYNNSTGKITVSGTATVTSANASGNSGTIHLVKVPSDNSDLVVLEITGGTVENTANPAGYAVYFVSTSVTTDNLSDYYSKTGGIVGRVHPTPPVVEITRDSNTTLYTTLAGAITAAVTGDTLKVIADIDLGGTGVEITNGKALTLDLNGHNITHSGTSESSAIQLLNVANTALTVKDSSSGQTGTLEATSGRAISNLGGGTVTIESGTVTAKVTAIYNSSTGTVEVSGGTVSSTYQGGRAISNTGAGTITVSGGMVSATGTGCNAIQNTTTGTVTVTSGTVSVTNGGVAISNTSTGAVNISGGEVSATDGTAIVNNGTGAVNISDSAEVKATDALGNAIYNGSTGKITINGTATVTSANTRNNSGTIYLNAVPTVEPKTVLDIQSGTVENTEVTGYAVYFNTNNTDVTYDTLNTYYTAAEGAQVGRVYPAAPAVPTAVTSQPTPCIYANGAELLLEADPANTSNTVVKYRPMGSADEVPYTTFNINSSDSNDLSSYNVHGGTGGSSGSADLIGNTKITMTGGKVYYIYGGGNSKKVTGNASVIMKGGTAYRLSGGGNNGSSEVTGTANVTIAGGTVSYDVYGGGSGKVTQGTFVTMTGGTVNGAVWGGSSGGAITNGTNVTITGGTVNGAVYGGTNGGTISGNVNVTIGGTAKIGGTGNGVDINAANGTAGVDSFKIDPNLTDEASVHVFLPAGYTEGTIATEAVAADLAKITLTGDGATGKEAYLDGTEIKVRTSLKPVTVFGSDDQQKESYDTLAAAIGAAATGDKLVINKDINLDTTGVSFSGKALTLDLNGQTVTYSGSGSAISLSGDTNTGLTVKDSSGGENGKLEANGSNGIAINNGSTGEVKVTGGTVSMTNSNGYAVCNSSTGTVTVSGGTLETNAGAGKTIYNALTGAVNICGGTVKATGTSGSAIFNVSTGKITISDSATVTSANESSTSGTIHLNAVPSGSGDPKTVLDITGGTVSNTVTDGYAVYFYPSSVTAANLHTYYTKTGGTVGRVYPAAVELLGSDDAFKGSYATLAAAIGVATTGDKLKVIADIDLGSGASVDINGIALTLDLNGHTVSHSGSEPTSVAIKLINVEGTGLTVMDSSTFRNGKLEAVNVAIHNAFSGAVTITGGTVSSTGQIGTAISGSTKVTGGTVTASGAYGAAISSDSAITVEGGTVKATASNGRAISSSGVNGTVNISGGTVSATNASGTAIYKGDSAGKVTISGNAKVTSANTSNNSGTICLGAVPPNSSSVTALEITGGTVKNTAGGNAVYNKFAGAIAVSGGTVETDSTLGKTINNASTGAVTISGGTVKATGVAINNAGTVNVSGGTVEATGTSGIAIWNTSTGKVTISDSATVTSANTNANEGTIRFNETTDSSAVVLEITGGTVKNTASGNAVYNASTGTVNVSGGTVEATTGNAIYNHATGTVTVSGGTVSATTGNAIFNGGALTVTNGTVKATGEKGRAIVSVGAVTVSGGAVSATDGYAIFSMGSVNVSGGKVESTSSCAIYNNSVYNTSTGKITISGTATVTSGNASATSGTIYINAVPTGEDLVMLDIQNTAEVTNTATPTAGYAVYFADDSVNSSNVTSYYKVAEGAQVGKVYPAPAAMPTVEVNSSGKPKTVYANGAALIIAGTSYDSTTIYVDIDGDGALDTNVDKSLKTLGIEKAPDDGSDLRSCTVYGGSKESALTGSPKITMTGGSVLYIYGGGKGTGGTVAGDPEIMITGGNASSVYGGGSDGGTVTGSPKIEVTGGNPSTIYGGGDKANLIGSPVIEMTGGQASLVYGSGRADNSSAGNVTGDTSITVANSAEVSNSVYGGGNCSEVSGKATVVFNIPNGNNKITIYGGGIGQTASVGSTEVTLGSSGKVKNVCGGGSGSSNVTGTAEVTVQGTTMNVCGVSDSSGSTVTGQVTVKVDGAAKVGNRGFTNVGLQINGGTAPEKKGVNSFVIGALQDDAKIDVILPAGYETGVIATQAEESDLAKLSLIGPGATGKLMRFDADKGEIYVIDPPAAEYTTNGGTNWTECDSLSDAITAMAGADNAATHRVRLMQDADTALEIQSGTFTLDLNGHQLAPDEGTATVTVGKKAALTLTDGVGGGKLVGAKKKVASAAMAGVGVSVEGSLTVTGGKPFTIQGGGSSEATGESAIALVTGSKLQVSGTGAIRMQGGDGLGTNLGASAIHTVRATILCDNPNAVYQGGDSKGTSGQHGGDGLLANTSIDAIIRGGTFIGGKGGDNTSGNGDNGGDGGDGIRVSISGASAARSLVVDGGTFIGGAGGSEATYPGHRGDGLHVNGADVTINGGVFEGRYGCWLANSAQAANNQWMVTGGLFTGDTIGLYVDANANNSLVVSVMGGTFTGNKYALTSTRANILKGGTFIVNGESAYAIKGYNSILTGQMLTAGMAYFDASGTQITTGLDADQLGKGATIQVAPATSKPDPVYNITGTVYENDGQPAKNASVTLKLGATVVSRTTTNDQGQYTFPSVKPGLYNVVAQKDKLTMTILVQLTNSDADNQTITLPDGAKNSEVEVAQDTRPVIVGGVEQIAADQTKPGVGESVTIKLTVEAKTEPDHKDEIISVAGDKTLEYLDVTLTRIKTSAAGAVNEENLGESNTRVLELVLPYVFEGKTDVTVYRKHGNDPAVALAQNHSKADGTFWADTQNGYLHIFASKFSTYAVGYTTATTPPVVDPGTSGGGGGGGTSSYTITATAGAGGSISPSGKVNVTRNGDKTFTIKPDSGYTVADVLVDGKRVGAVERYTFEKVTKAHTITVRFQKETEKAAWNPFADVRAGDWFYESVQYVYEHDLMLGTSATTFSPTASTERGMIVTILWRMEGQPEATNAQDFSDVQSGDYYAQAVAWANENGIALGYGNGKFGPKDTITREQLAAVLYRYAQYKGADVGAGGALDRFTDTAEISGYAREPMAWAVEQGIITGKGGGVLAPKGQATRGETAAMLMRYLQG